LRIDARIGDPRIEVDPGDSPVSGLADGGHERPDIKVGMAVTECLPNSVEQILSIDERNCSWVGGLRGQMLPLKK